MQAPPIDTRSYEEIVEDTKHLAQRYSDWRPRTDGLLDTGETLIRIFGRFAELVVERINRAPEKNQLAFLNLIGTPMQPPLPARVPLTFQLASSSPVDAVVPTCTQVSAPPLEGETDEVIFETRRSLVVTRTQLQAVYVSDTETDTYSDRTTQAIGMVAEPFAAFSGDPSSDPRMLYQPHQLYLACDSLLTTPGAKDITLALWSPDTVQWQNWNFSWAYWDGTIWKTIQPETNVADGAWRVRFAELPQLPLYFVNGIQAGWLRIQLNHPLAAGESGLVPESVAVGNKQPQDMDGMVAPFGETDTVKWFYLSADDALAPGGAFVQFQVALERRGIASTSAVKLNWSYRVGDDWVPLGQSSSAAPQLGTTNFDFRDNTLAFTNDGAISFHVPLKWPRERFYNRLGRWMRVEIVGDGEQYKIRPHIKSLAVSYAWELPRISRITVQLNKPAEALTPTTAFFNTGTLDLSKDFYPLGEQPRFNDTCYIAIPESLVQPNTKVKLNITLTNPADGSFSPPVRTDGNPKLLWEVWDGQAWNKVPADDTTKGVTANGSVTITLPSQVAPTSVNGQKQCWLRARLNGGNYGEAAKYKAATRTVTTTTGATKTETTYPVDELVPATWAPPVIQSLTLESVSAQQITTPVSACLGYNDFIYTDHVTDLVRSDQAFTPFSPTADHEPALYLGFDQPFDPRPVTLYLQVEPPRPEEVSADQLIDIDPLTLAQIIWEYAVPNGWKSLGAVDETQTLSSSGLVTFVGPRDVVERSYFGQTVYWLRARWQRGFFPLPPRLRRVLLNTTWAEQVTTVKNENLGSGNSNPNQMFRTAQAPVQSGQQLVVRERQRPSPAECKALVALEGVDAITVTEDAAGQPDEIWVRWHAVVDFYDSGPRDRHYTIDALTGEICFGDGQAGLIPSQGQNNIRITYRTGGGEQGNRAAGTIVQLKSGIPYIDTVTNYESAQGGAPREPIDQLKARGSRILRHRDRAVTYEDIEDLAYEASADVARAAAIAPTFDPYSLWLDPLAPVPTDAHRQVNAGRVNVIVVPNTDSARPIPSLGLLRQVETYLRLRCSPTATFGVSGPEWVRVTVAITVVPVSLDVADVVAVRVRTALDGFLHPLTGGSKGQGWAFGRKPHSSDVFAVVKAVQGVDHVRSLSMNNEPESSVFADRLVKVLNQSLTYTFEHPPEPNMQQWLDRALVYSGQHEVTVALY